MEKLSAHKCRFYPHSACLVEVRDFCVPISHNGFWGPSGHVAHLRVVSMHQHHPGKSGPKDPTDRSHWSIVLISITRLHLSVTEISTSEETLHLDTECYSTQMMMIEWMPLKCKKWITLQIILTLPSLLPAFRSTTGQENRNTTISPRWRTDLISWTPNRPLNWPATWVHVKSNFFWSAFTANTI